jgi:large subunit ribosomal protein L3
MNKAIIGKKLGMSQVFAADGTVIPVTVILAGPCPVVQVKTVQKEGYSAVQLGFNSVAGRFLSKPEAGHCKKAGLQPYKTLKEFKLDNAENYKTGTEIKCDIFAEGDMVDVIGTTKGHGYSGAIKKWNQNRMFVSHGTGPCVRQSGSMGSNTSPGTVKPGKHLAGHYGLDRVTIINLKVVKVDPERNLLLVKGAVPGPKGSVVFVRSAVKSAKN